MADELLKQTNGGRIEQLARNGIPVFFLSLNAQELTRFHPSLPPSFSSRVSVKRGMRQTNHEPRVHADYLYYRHSRKYGIRVSASSIVRFFRARKKKESYEKERKEGKKDKQENDKVTKIESALLLTLLSLEKKKKRKLNPLITAVHLSYKIRTISRKILRKKKRREKRRPRFAMTLNPL